MLHSTIVASEAAQETSTKAVRHRQTQVIPRGSYSFGDAELAPGSCITIQPKPVSRVISVHQSAVAPDSLPGSALPRDTAVMPTGEMRVLGEPLVAVPAAFRHGVAGDKRSIIGDREVRRVGNTLMPMAPAMRDYERNPISQDRQYPNSSSSTSVLPNYGVAPDDRLRQKFIQPNSPGMTVERTPLVYADSPGQAFDSRTRYEKSEIAPTEPGVVTPRHRIVSRAPVQGLSNVSARTNLFMGAMALAIAGGVYWLVIRKD
jgi:hypothetical protein